MSNPTSSLAGENGRFLVRVVPGSRLSALEAVTAEDRLPRRGVEGHFRLLPAFGAGGRVELARRGRVSPTPTTAAAIPTGGVSTTTIIAIAGGGVPPAGIATSTILVALRLASLSACRTPLRIGKTPLLIKFLFTCREHEFLPAIATGQRSFTHSA